MAWSSTSRTSRLSAAAKELIPHELISSWIRLQNKLVNEGFWFLQDFSFFNRFLIAQVIDDEGVFRVFVVALGELCVGVEVFADLI